MCTSVGIKGSILGGRKTQTCGNQNVYKEVKNTGNRYYMNKYKKLSPLFKSLLKILVRAKIITASYQVYDVIDFKYVMKLVQSLWEEKWKYDIVSLLYYM